MRELLSFSVKNKHFILFVNLGGEKMAGRGGGPEMSGLSPQPFLRLALKGAPVRSFQAQRNFAAWSPRARQVGNLKI
jgi:hypothetical protein